jgi:hypothetical protein
MLFPQPFSGNLAVDRTNVEIDLPSGEGFVSSLFDEGIVTVGSLRHLL